MSTPACLPGKGLSYGGSLARTEATGFGVCYFTKEMLENNGMSFQGKRVVISGSGNVAIYCAQKAMEYGATVVAMSDSSGYIYDENGMNLDVMKQLKEVERARISEYPKRVPTATFTAGCSGIWSIPCDIAFPCATQNEIDLDSAKKLIANGCKAVAEGAICRLLLMQLMLFLMREFFLDLQRLLMQVELLLQDLKCHRTQSSFVDI